MATAMAQNSQTSVKQSAAPPSKRVENDYDKQISKLETDVEKLKSRGADLERALATQHAEKKAAISARNALLDRYNALRKSATQLESFRKSIVNMVEHVPPANVPDIERSFIGNSTPTNQQNPFVTSRNFNGVASTGGLTGAHDVISENSLEADYLGQTNQSFMDDSTLQLPDLGGSTLNYSFAPSFNDRSFGGGGQYPQQQQQQHQQRRTIPSPVMNPEQSPNSRVLQVPATPSRQKEQQRTNASQPGDGRNEGDSRSKDGKARHLSFSADAKSNPQNSRDRHATASTPNLRLFTPIADHPEPSPKVTTPSHPATTSPPTSTLIDAPILYKQIRDSLSPKDFEDFAANVAAFNAAQQTAEETVTKIGKIVKERELFGAMKGLIFTALAESGGEGGGGEGQGEVGGK